MCEHNGQYSLYSFSAFTINWYDLLLFLERETLFSYFLGFACDVFYVLPIHKKANEYFVSFW